MTATPLNTPSASGYSNAEKIASPESNRFLQSTLDALSSHIAILDERGTIIEVNAAWNRFACDNNGVGGQCGVGADYLKACDSACDSFSKEASAMAEGIRAVIAGQRREFLLEYPCHSPEEERWFIARATRFAGDGLVRVVIAHENITGRKRDEEALSKIKTRLAHAMSLAQLVAWEYDVASGRFTFSDSYYALHGTTSELEGGDVMSSETFARKFMHPDDAHLVGEEIAKAVATADPDYVSQVEVRLFRRDGEVRDVSTHIAITKDASGRTIQLRGANQDITERKKSEHQLRKLWRAVEQSPASIVITDLQGGIEYVNPKFCAITGYGFEEAHGQNPRVLKSGEMSAETYSQLWATITAGEEWRGEFHNRKKNGELYWESASISPIRDDKGKVTHFVAIKEDITERKRALEDLKRTEKESAESQRRLKAILDAAADHIWLRDRDGRFLAANRAWCDFAGIKESQMVGKTLADLPELYPAELAKRLRAEDEAVMSSGKISQGEFQITSASLDTVWLESSKAPLLDEEGVSCGVVGIGRDITKRKQVEEELRWKTAFLEAQANTSIDGILVVDKHGSKKLQNQQMGDLLKIPRHIVESRNDEIQLKWVSQMTKDPEQFIENVRFLNSHQKEISRDEMEMKDGTILDRYTAPMVGGDGKYYGRMWTFRDITERRRAEESLRESEEKFRQLADNITDVFWMTSPDLKTIHYVSPGYELIWGHTIESLHDNPHQWVEAILPAQRDSVFAVFTRLMSNEPAVSVEYQIARPDGTVRWIYDRGFQVRDAAGKLIRLAGIASDITESKRLAQEVIEHKDNEEHSRQELKLERELNRIKSQFVSMVSHEFRTPLCVINTAAYLLGGYSERLTSEELSEHAKEIQFAVGRMTRMMEDLLVHEKLQAGKMECRLSHLDLDVFCRELISELASLPGAACVIECAIDPAVREAFLDERILRHVLCNLLSNAIKYSLDGQPVKLEVTRVAANAPIAGGARAPQGDHIQLLVRDSGIGIPAADLAKVFQAFHRSANVGNRPGTGMGLAIVKKFVDLHRGMIHVESTEGKGTTVWVWLPVASSEVPDHPPSSVGSAGTGPAASLTQELGLGPLVLH
ncbi:MAG: PAS domain S-box protein [Verrucomicrobiota bacterium]|jgi:PAS domain S-box-containing protein